MRGVRVIGIICGALVALALASPAAMAVGGPADWMYEPTSIAEVHLTLPPESIAELEAEPKEYVEGTFSLAETDGTPGTAATFSPPLTVGIEIKGNYGSLRRISEKAAFKIKFNKYVEGQSFLGLEKMTLNNMVQDPSMVHETTTYEAFHEMGVPAPHVGFAYLSINGESYGLHLNIETQDAQSVENEFGTPFLSPPQHLYAGEYGADASDAPYGHGGSLKKWEALEVSEGKKKEKGDLEALVAAVEATTPSFAQRVASVADLPEMTKDWLVEKYVGNWDGYAGDVDELHPNNYYLYSEAPDPNSSVQRFQLMPWGTDQTWQLGEELNFESGGGGILFNDCLADTTGCRQTYLAAAHEALSVLNATSLDTTARCAAASLRPWQELEAKISAQEKLPDPSADGAENLAKAAEEVRDTRIFIGERPEELAAFLGEPAPPPGTEPACPPLRPVGGFRPTPPSSAPAAPAVAPAGTTPTAPPRLGSIAVVHHRHAGNSISVRLVVPGGGRLVVHGSYGTGRAGACRGTAETSAAGTVMVTCRFTRRFAALLDQRWRRIRLDARFVAAGGATAQVDRVIRLPRS
jgi:CotH kinase protein